MMNHWTESIFNKAYRHYERGNITKAFEWFLKGAKAGNTDCMLWVGVLYGDGIEIDQNNDNELFWYKKAWGKGDKCAPNNIAIVYKNQKKYKQAAHWFQIAINNDDGDANLELAKMYISIKESKDKIKQLLLDTINSKHVTEVSVEEANALLKKHT